MHFRIKKGGGTISHIFSIEKKIQTKKMENPREKVLEKDLVYINSH